MLTSFLIIAVLGQKAPAWSRYDTAIQTTRCRCGERIDGRNAFYQIKDLHRIEEEPKTSCHIEVSWIGDYTSTSGVKHTMLLNGTAIEVREIITPGKYRNQETWALVLVKSGHAVGKEVYVKTSEFTQGKPPKKMNELSHDPVTFDATTKNAYEWVAIWHDYVKIVQAAETRDVGFPSSHSSRLKVYFSFLNKDAQKLCDRYGLSHKGLSEMVVAARSQGWSVQSPKDILVVDKMIAKMAAWEAR